MNRTHERESAHRTRHLLASTTLVVLASAVLLILFASHGCARKETGQVSGKVLRGEEPIRSDGNVTWYVHFVDDRNNNFEGKVGPDGSYVVENVPVGRVRIAVVGRSADDKLPFPEPKSGAVQSRSNFLSEAELTKYHDPDKTSLTYSVRRGVQNHDIALK